MIVTVRVPLRVNFVAGGTDLPAFVKHGTGGIVGTTIAASIYVTVKSYMGKGVRLHYAQSETVEHRDQLQHTRVKAALEHFDIEGGIEIASLADVPGGTGLGSSGAFTVGLLHALNAYRQYRRDPFELAHTAIALETSLETVGSQDQLFAAIGGGLHLTPRHGHIAVQEVPGIADLCKYFMLVMTPYRRHATDLLTAQSANIENNFADMAAIAALAQQAVAYIEDRQYRHLGSLIHEVWSIKKGLAPGMSNPDIDAMYDSALAAGAWGGKLQGAGGGGAFLLMAPPSAHLEIWQALRLPALPVTYYGEGASVIYEADV